jgi:hypothetical protein
LGIFLLAFFIKFVRGKAVFIAAIITQITILGLYYFAIAKPQQVGGEVLLSYLWLNLIGCGLVMILAFCTQLLLKITPDKK